MRIVVAIKQVPFVDQLKFDPDAKRLIREGVESEINPFDKRALTAAINLKKTFEVEVVVVTMGPPQARDALVEALAMGADRAVHLLGREFAGADTLATARTLALVCQKIGYDLILCGKYSTDAETAQVPSMLAEFLHIPQITAVTELAFPDPSQVRAKREMDQGFETLECALPVVLSAAERLAKPIKVAPGDLDKGKQKPIEVITPQDLSTDTRIFGLEGSPTWVSGIFSIEPTRRHLFRAAAENVDAVAHEVVRDLVAEGLASQWKSRPYELIQPKPRAENTNPRSIWVVAEVVSEVAENLGTFTKLRPVTFELLGRAVQLANENNGDVAAILIGDGVSLHARELAACGADRVYVADAPALASYATETYTAVLAEAIREFKPYAVLVPSTSQGRDLAPRVAARLDVGLTGDCIGLEIDGEGRLVQLKPAFGGNIVAPILTKTSPALATVRPGMLLPAQRDASREPILIDLPVDHLPQPTARVVATDYAATIGVALDNAEVIVGVGMGVGGPENLPVVQELAAALNAPVGGTRKVVDAGWLPRQMQIGLTGRSVSPRLYVAVGISGKFNHVVGIQRAGLVLAINSNPDAEIFKQADFGIVGDWAQVVPALTRAVREISRLARRGGFARHDTRSTNHKEEEK